MKEHDIREMLLEDVRMDSVRITLAPLELYSTDTLLFLHTELREIGKKLLEDADPNFMQRIRRHNKVM